MKGACLPLYSRLLDPAAAALGAASQTSDALGFFTMRAPRKFVCRT
eukprot:CAMPEP_0177485334 /NCGR_PEP_ID=MMETSP0369-20130122/28500_1 /TAXON_ID=447022 ORGANISM="Scrippsiella hangoei-like, Strain SHHI-4" /NCGR_SAMPLE_ID=MMETSP0369 /ASSEMBLY_ACC=CAM_ASM_000364 /LENGTH=45 /DNA_ID= /DNA_START= /DNA_END= /DNA_ORIENTATION=